MARASEPPHSKIKYGRIIISCIIAIVFASILCYSIVQDARLDAERRDYLMDNGARILVIGLQITDFVLLTVSIVVLVILLRKFAKFESQGKTFKKEVRTLIAFLIIFDISYF